MSTICRFDLLQKQLDSCLDEQATGMILLFDQKSPGNNDHYLSQRQLCSQLTWILKGVLEVTSLLYNFEERSPCLEGFDFFLNAFFKAKHFFEKVHKWYMRI